MQYVEENCCVEHGHRRFCAGAAVVTPAAIIAYPRFASEYVGKHGTLHDWRGHQIGTCVITASWRTPRSFVASHMYQIEAEVDGVLYTGRGTGSGMIYRGRVKRDGDRRG